MNIFKLFAIASCMSTVLLSSFAAKAESGSMSIQQSKITTVYPAGSSFKKIVLSGQNIPCSGKNWLVSWTAKEDIILPASVSVNDSFDGVVSKVYMSFFDNQEKMKDTLWSNLQIETDNFCTITVSDKA